MSVTALLEMSAPWIDSRHATGCDARGWVA